MTTVTITDPLATVTVVDESIEVTTVLVPTIEVVEVGTVGPPGPQGPSGSGGGGGIETITADPPLSVDDTDPANPVISLTGSVGAVETIMPTAPITVNSTDPANPIVGISAATTGAAGSMSATDKAKLDAATDANTASAIVRRDASGNFSAGTITAALAGNATTATNGVVTTGSYADPAWITSLAGAKITGTVANATNAATVTNGVVTTGSYSDPAWITALAGAKITGTVANATAAVSFSGSLVGDVSGTQGATVVDTVGGQTAANVAAGAVLANAATDANTASAIVRRDSGGAVIIGGLTVPVAPTATANRGLVSLGSGPFDGSTSGFFVGSASGTHLAINGASGFAGNLLDAQVAGVSRLKLAGNTGAITATGVATAGGARLLLLTPGAHTAVTAETRALEVASHTLTITGSYANQRFTFFGRPTITAASALTITTAATVTIFDAPTAAGSATITNPYALQVAAGRCFFGGALTVSPTLTDPTTDDGGIVTTTIHALTADSANVLNGQKIVLSGSSNFNYGSVNGLTVSPTYSGSGTVSSLAGIKVNSTSNNSGTVALHQGLIISAAHGGASAVTNMDGINATIRITATGGSSTTACAFQAAAVFQSNVTVTNYHGFLLNQATISSTASISVARGATISAQINTASGSSTTGGFSATGVHITVPTQGGNTSGTNTNRGIYITGNGGTAGSGGTVTNHALYSDSTAPSLLSGPLLMSSARLLQAEGSNVSAANNLVLGSGGNTFHITGATQINLLASTSWQGGATVTLIFDSTPTVKHNQTASGVNAPIMLNGAVDFVAAADNTLTLVYDSTNSKWYEIGRKT